MFCFSVGSIGEQEQLGAVSCHISKRKRGRRNNARASVAMAAAWRECRRRNDELNKVCPERKKKRGS